MSLKVPLDDSCWYMNSVPVGPNCRLPVAACPDAVVHIVPANVMLNMYLATMRCFMIGWLL